MILQWSRQARQDLRAIHEFIARMPTMGHPVHEFPELDLRETHQENYRIIYAHAAEELQVVTIVHMKQQMKRSRLSK